MGIAEVKDERQPRQERAGLVLVLALRQARLVGRRMGRWKRVRAGQRGHGEALVTWTWRQWRSAAEKCAIGMLFGN